MKSVRSVILACFVYAIFASTSIGQGAPAQIDAALLDLSARLGYSVGIGNLSNWRWEQKNFADDALDCATASGSGGGSVLGYQFMLTHSGMTYDYRVSADNALVILCGQLDPNQATDTPDPGTQYSNRLCSDTATDGPYMRSRINAGMDILVLQGFLNLRGQPSADGQILLQVPAGWPVGITAGPDCVDGYVWWLALVNGQTGYIAESGEGAYFVEPKPPPTIPATEVLNTNVVQYLQEFGKVSGNFQPNHAWSSDGVYIGLPGSPGSDSVWLYDMRQQTLKPQILEFDSGITALEFRPNSAQIAFGSESGTLRLWQIVDGAELTYSDRLFLNAHAGSISAIAFSEDGNRLASAGPEAYTHVEVNRQWAAIIWDLPTVGQQAVLSGHQGLIRALAFSPDGNVIVSGGDDSAPRFWDAYSGAYLSPLNQGDFTTVLDYSPDGLQLAVGFARASDNLLIFDDAARPPIASYQLPTITVTSVDFSPDNSMLVVGAAEGIFTVWDTDTHQLLATRETDGGVFDVSFNPDGSLITVSTEKHSLLFYGVPLGSG